VVPPPPLQAVKIARKARPVSCARNINHLSTTKVYLDPILLERSHCKASGVEMPAANHPLNMDAIKIEPWLSVARYAALRDGHEHQIHLLRALLVIAMHSSS